MGIYIFTLYSYTDAYLKELTRTLVLEYPMDKLNRGLKFSRYLFEGSDPAKRLREIYKTISPNYNTIAGVRSLLAEIENFSNLRHAIAHGDPNYNYLDKYINMIPTNAKESWSHVYEIFKSDIKQYIKKSINKLSPENNPLSRIFRNKKLEELVRSIFNYVDQELQIFIEMYSGLYYFTKIFLTVGLFTEVLISRQLELWETQN